MMELGLCMSVILTTSPQSQIRGAHLCSIKWEAECGMVVAKHIYTP